MDSWTGYLSNVAPPSRFCDKTRTRLCSGRDQKRPGHPNRWTASVSLAACRRERRSNHSSRSAPPLLRAYLMADLCCKHRNGVGNMLKAKYNRSEGQEHCCSLKNTRAACDKGTDDTPSSTLGSRGRASCLVSLLMHLSGI